ncbi:MAG: 16S rRNA (guanine(527)-N(7))-methyltransferase RsmG [Acidobacteriota bacterium]
MSADDRMALYLELLLSRNAGAGLTAFRDRQEVLRKGIAPSLQGEPFLPRGATVLDVGSGGGIPSLPLAIHRPDLGFVLCEPSGAKAQFLREAVGLLGVSAQVRCTTVEEELSRGGTYGAVTVRGVRLRRGLLKRLAKALEPGGSLLVWTGGDREALYAAWLRALGADVRRIDIPEAGIALLAATVPRGTVAPGDRDPHL